MDQETGLILSREHEDDGVPGASLLSGKAERPGTAQPGKDSGGSYPCVQIPQKGSKEDRDKAFSVVLMDRTRDNRHELKYRKLQLNIRKKFFTIREIQVSQGSCGLHPWRNPKPSGTRP